MLHPPPPNQPNLTSKQHNTNPPLPNPLPHLRRTQHSPEHLVPRLWDIEQGALLGVDVGGVEDDVG